MPTKQPMPSVPPLQPLLFWETGVLLFVAGIVTARFPVPALTACALFAWVDSRTRRPLCCLLAAACVIAGWWIGEKSVPRVPQEYPAWLEKSLSSRRAVTVEGVIVGSRGWTCPGSPDYTEQDQKLYLREAERFRLAFETVKPLRREGDKTIALIHYPPFNLKREDSLFTSLFENNGVDKVIFGHLHGPVFFPLSSEKNGVEYHLTSCDKTDFKLVKIY